MTKKVQGGAPAAKQKAEDVRTVLYVVNRPYSAGEAPEIVTARVKKEHEGDEDLLDLVIIEPSHGGEPEVKGVRKSEGREVGTWHEGVK
jgi:hypothetical protein